MTYITVPQRVIDRIYDRVDVRGSDECWPWKLSVSAEGYGFVGWKVTDGKSQKTTAHRVAWMAANGRQLHDLTVDHLCRNPVCCNPAHLEAVSIRENILRSDGPAAVNGRRERCANGHAFKHTGRQRVCPDCRLAAAQQRRVALVIQHRESVIQSIVEALIANDDGDMSYLRLAEIAVDAITATTNHPSTAKAESR